MNQPFQMMVASIKINLMEEMKNFMMVANLNACASAKGMSLVSQGKVPKF